MAELVRVEIADFKGIQSTSVDLSLSAFPKGRFVTLIGLNESGKTTVLEAISHSALADEETADLFETVQGKPELNSIVPKRHKSSYNGKVDIILTVRLSWEDRRAVQLYLASRHNFDLAGDIIPFEFRIHREYFFRNSLYQRTNTTWYFDPKVVKRNGKRKVTLSTYSQLKTEWHDTVRFIKDRLPRIVYFPTFLVDFPNRIYLEGEHGTSDRYFRGIIDDVLRSLEKRLNLADHIVSRAAAVRKKLDGQSLGSALRSSPEGQAIDATIQEVATELNTVIFGAWNDIFRRKITQKRINVEWHVDEDSKELYLEIYIIDGKYRYYIGERSLGFRWFFSFLIFTQFSTYRSSLSKVIYLFDEPASNLHARAQQRLLESFNKIAHPDHSIIYSTHSHYMINPRWLESAFIVQNRAVAADSDDPNEEFNVRDTDVVAIPYKRFVAENPTKTTYFQPALDALDYSMDDVSLMHGGLITEGKSDFFALRFLFSRLKDGDLLRIYPASGAGSMGALVSVLRAWAVPFLLLLDDDDAGRRARDRYRKKFQLDESEVATLGDLVPALVGKTLEALFKNDVISLFEKLGIQTTKKPTKAEFSLLFQTLMTNDVGDVNLTQTLKGIKKLREEVRSRLHQ